MVGTILNGLPVSRVVEVDVNFAPGAVPLVNFNTLLILGDSDVINTSDAVLRYEGGVTSVADDFGTTAPEYLAAVDYFGQTPRPNSLYIGRWARTATAGILNGGPLSGTEQLIATWQAITNGGFHIRADGAASPGVNVTGINLSGAVNMSAVAALVQTAVRAGGGALAAVSVLWDANRSRFQVKSGTTGITSSILALTAPTAGTDLSPVMKLTAATMEKSVAGIAAETPVAAVARVDGLGWYGVDFAASVMPTEAQELAVAAYIEAATNRHLYGITTQAANTLDSASTADLASQLALADYMRTTVQYSLTDPYAISSLFGSMFTVDFEGSNTTKTAKFKTEPGVTPEILTSAQADTLVAKRCNVYVRYNNGVSITQEGVMSGPAFFDEIHGLDWLANRLQTDVFNLLYTNPKIPQTNAGVNRVVNVMDGAFSQAVVNGLAAPGRWNLPGFGLLKEGDLMTKAWYSFAQKVEDQSQADRENRICPPITSAVKLAGAIHFARIALNVNR